MNFQGLQAKYQRLFDDNKAWKLLRADNAPLILAYLKDLFSEESEVPFSRARVALDAELIRLRDLGIREAETSAGVYLNQWIRSGWLREMDDMLTKTDAGETALRFCQGLDDRGTGTTASHLRIVQEAVRDFAVSISSNPNERMQRLKQKKIEIEREIDDIKAGVVIELSEAEKRERIKEIYQLASVLTGDFRRMEDEIRQMDKALRIQIVEGGSTRGEVLLSVMEKETLLEKTDAGSAFEAFFQLLCDQNRSIEFREQLRSILARPVAEHLSPAQQQFLHQLMRELTKESERVFQIRRRTVEGLRAYIENGAVEENRAVNILLGKLERTALSLRNAGCDLKTPTTLSLPVGSAIISSPETMRLRSPDEKIDTSGIEERINSRTPTSEMLSCFDSVQIREIADRALETLRKHGPMTIASIIKVNPLESGLEELVAYLRVAKSVGASRLEEKETVEFSDKEGALLQATIPTFLLGEDLFPKDPNDLFF